MCPNFLFLFHGPNWGYSGDGVTTPKYFLISYYLRPLSFFLPLQRSRGQMVIHLYHRPTKSCGRSRSSSALKTFTTYFIGMTTSYLKQLFINILLLYIENFEKIKTSSIRCPDYFLCFFGHFEKNQENDF